MRSRRTRLAAAVALSFAVLTTASYEAKAGRVDPETAVTTARKEGNYTFCTKPRTPLLGRQKSLCPLATEVDHCDGLMAACAHEPPDMAWLERFLALAAPLGRALLWFLLVAAFLSVVVPLVATLRRLARRAGPSGKPSTTRNAAVPAEDERRAEEPCDPDATLRLADEHAARGETDQALALYLSAALAALNRRGALRLSPDRTNGEYLRACREVEAREALREIVREVERVSFGKLTANAESVARVATRAQSVVGAGKRLAASLPIVSMLTIFVLALCGCGPAGGKDDPAGDQLPLEVLERTGFRVAPLARSVVGLPVPQDGDDPAILVLDLERVPLEDETTAHLLRWTERGGTLVLMGSPRNWPEDFGAKPAYASTTALRVEGVAATGDAARARVALPIGVSFPKATGVAWLGQTSYAGVMPYGLGSVLGVASDDLMTNVGVARPDNATALASLMSFAVAEAKQRHPDWAEPLAIRIARREDGIPPPSNPFAALVRAGLGSFVAHALFAALLLFAAYGTRHARPEPTSPPLRRAFTEHVEATGAFYARARAAPLALAAYGRFVEGYVRRRLPRGGDPALFLAAKSGVDPDEVSALYERATRAVPDDERRGDELATIRALASVVAKATR